MNRIGLLTAFVVIGLSCVMGAGKNYFSTNTNMEVMSDSVYDEVLRFHVLANSDSDEDQKLKMKVKSVLAGKLAEDMGRAGVDSKDEAWDYVSDNIQYYIDLAQMVIREEGYDYIVTATLGKHWFPVKVYGNCVYPEGEYDAFRILIGEAEGKNWWCVLFPSLCMVDEAYVVPQESDESENVKIRFRIVEWIEELW